MDVSSHHERFKKFYFEKEGKLYRSIELRIGDYTYNYDIRWGDPNIIFDPQSKKNTWPLAVTIIPHRYGYPVPGVFLHELVDECIHRPKPDGFSGTAEWQLSSDVLPADKVRNGCTRPPGSVLAACLTGD